MNSRGKQIVLLVALGVFMGMGAAWIDAVKGDAGSGYAKIEPAAGVSTTAAAIGGDFSLTDQNGKTFTSGDLDGSYRLIFFGFTYCPEICPTELQKMATVLKTLGPDAEKIKPVFITVDPARDTPEVMKSYVEQFDSRIIGLTGAAEDLKDVQDAYKVYAAKVQDPAMSEYTMNHSAYTFFMGPNGELIELFGTDDAPADIVKRIQKEI